METSNTANTTEAKFQWRIRLATILGFPLYLHASCFLWCVVLLWVGVTDAILLVSLLVFSITFHEFAHALTCRLLGFGDGTLTVWVFGGYFMPFSRTTLFDMERGQRVRYAFMILAGPLSNLLLAGLFVLLAYLTTVEILYTAASYNLMLAILNLMPVGRLDGGGILTYLGSTIMHWRKATFFAGVLSLVLAAGIFVAIFTDHWLGDYSSWAGFLIMMGISTIQASRKSEGEVRAESQEQVAKEMAFVESTSHADTKLLSFLFAIGLASMLVFSVWHIARAYSVYHDLPGQIVYVDQNYSNIDLHVLKNLGYPTTKVSGSLTEQPPFPSSAVEGNVIAFGCVLRRTAEQLGLCIVDRQGNLWKELPLHNYEGIQSLLLSPTGQKVALSFAEGEIRVIDLTTEEVESFFVEGTLEVWSPNEDYLLVSSNTGGKNDVLAINLRDRKIENLPRRPYYDYSAVFSQSGGTIYLMADTFDKNVLFRLDLEVPDFTRIGTIDMMYDNHASFKISPDHSKIVFECGQGFICVANLDGSDSKTLAAGEMPVWSPDSKYIAYFSRYDRSDPYSIFVVQSDGELPFKIKSLEGWGSYLEWTP